MHLEVGKPFPQISGTTIKGKELTIPADLAGNWSALLFYRGHF